MLYSTHIHLKNTKCRVCVYCNENSVQSMKVAWILSIVIDNGDIKFALFSGSVYWNSFSIFIYPIKIAIRSINLFFIYFLSEPNYTLRKQWHFYENIQKIWINKYMTYLCSEWVNTVELTFLFKFAYEPHNFPLKFQGFLMLSLFCREHNC